MAIPNPIVERERLKGGYVQFMLAALILEDAPKGWNQRHQSSARGSKFLHELDSLCFGATSPTDPEAPVSSRGYRMFGG